MVENVRCHDNVDDHLPETLDLGFGGEDALLKRAELFLVHEQIPGEIYTVLLCHTLVLVLFGNGNPFLYQLSIRNSYVSNEEQQAGPVVRRRTILSQLTYYVEISPQWSQS